MPILMRTNVDYKMKKFLLYFLLISSSVFAGNGYEMFSSTSCGPSSVSYVTGKSIDWVKNAFDWPNKNDWRDNTHDTPITHYLALQRLGVSYRIVPLTAILSGSCQPEKTVILIHSVGVVNSWLYQHWVVLRSVSPQSITVWWGDAVGSYRSFTPANFVLAYTRGFPNCAYEISDGKAPSWWVWLKGVFGK